MVVVVHGSLHGVSGDRHQQTTGHKTAKRMNLITDLWSKLHLDAKIFWLSLPDDFLKFSYRNEEKVGCDSVSSE